MVASEEIQRYLRENGVPFQVQHHPLAYTAQEVAASEHIPGKLLAKVVMVMTDGRLAMFVLPAPQRVDLARAGVVLQAKEVRLARESEFAHAFPGADVGAEPPFGNLYDLPVYVDRSLAEEEEIYFRAGTHTDTLSMRYADFQRLVNPVVAQLAAD